MFIFFKYGQLLFVFFFFKKLTQCIVNSDSDDGVITDDNNENMHKLPRKVKKNTNLKKRRKIGKQGIGGKNRGGSIRKTGTNTRNITKTKTKSKRRKISTVSSALDSDMDATTPISDNPDTGVPSERLGMRSRPTNDTNFTSEHIKSVKSRSGHDDNGDHSSGYLLSVPLCFFFLCCSKTTH